MSRVGKKATSCGEKVGNWREKNLIQLRLLEEIAILAVPLYEAAVAMIAVGIDSASPARLCTSPGRRRTLLDAGVARTHRQSRSHIDPDCTILGSSDTTVGRDRVTTRMRRSAVVE